MIVLCANSTSWDERTDRLIPGGQGDRYLRPILTALPAGSAVISRQPHPGEVNVYMNHRSAYRPERWQGERAAVQISHGIASKTYRSQANVGSFTHVVVPGPALAQEVIESGVPADKVYQLGYPKLDPIFAGQVASPWPARDGRIRVLWAPTHGGGSERWANGNRRAPGARATTWWQRDHLLRGLSPEQVHLMAAPHPRHAAGRQATLAQYVGADVVIADGGSTMYEAWALGLPVVFADWLTRDRNLERAQGTTLEARVYREQIGWHVNNRNGLAEVVDEAAKNGITEAETAFAAEVLPVEYRGRGGLMHAEMLMEVHGA